MEPVLWVRGRMMPLVRDDVDTDQIMPKQFLSRVERDGFGEFVFHEWRRDPEFVFNDPRFSGARILVAGSNFGSGSSREHAVWGLQQYGFDAVVAPSFSDIFTGNCAQAGVVPAVVPPELCRSLQAAAERDPDSGVELDLTTMRVMWTGGSGTFHLDDQVREVLLHGLDDVALVLGQLDVITQYERARPAWMPHLDVSVVPGAAVGPDAGTTP
ncbi:3-isopropylmalate dehydratase small subunit [Actinomycetospora sp. NBRC 106375]|uniref:3-isopropylmalate dehydratase small subunit n=1 Tax=Actinomycetospora sp. NBRC 106375 TaxID=3032207 RepID=UPI0024A0AF2C|nr:3-isopropylmalate dehydratase small subunit [Actinomycetospora sp. NBRC 106375]GLZ49875.1 3-isopropylmalate dehydratase small subunit [Actinomycetospora sp. NBRC 106375]